MITVLDEPYLENRKGKWMPLYEQIGLKLRERIETEPIRPGETLPSISQLVREWGVNSRTVLAAMELLEKEGVIDRRPYRRAMVAGRAFQKESLIFIRWASDSFSVAALNGIQKYLHQVDQEVAIMDAAGSHENILAAIAHPPEGIQGMILMPFETPEYRKAVQDAQARDVKVVFLDWFLPGIAAGAVANDYFTGAYQATKHLIEAHDSPVFYLGNVAMTSSSTEHRRGWRTAMQEHNYLDTDYYQMELPSGQGDAEVSSEPIWIHSKKQIQELFDRVKLERYCILAGSDDIARGVYLASKEKELAVGREVFVVGFGDAPFCTKLTPPLSSVPISAEALGFEAAKLLYRELAGEVTRPICRIVPLELRIRESSRGI
jgi:DNA-binding LacI/PurR family transcriptional regulator